MSAGRWYSKADDDFIIAHYREMSVGDIAVALSRSERGIRKRASDLGVTRSMRRWTSPEDAVILAARGRSIEDVARELDRGVSEVSERAKRLAGGWKEVSGYKPTKSGYQVAGHRTRPSGRKERIVLHRAVMEHHLGRLLERGEVVHHINGDKSDCRLENLYLCADAGSHRRAHVSIEHLLPDLLGSGIVYFDRDRGEYCICETSR